MPVGRVRASVRSTSLSSPAKVPLPVLDWAGQDALAEQALPGILMIAHLVETLLQTGRVTLLQTGRVPTPGFWLMPMARSAAVLVAARRCPGRMPTAADLVAVGWPEAAIVICDEAVADLVDALGLVA